MYKIFKAYWIVMCMVVAVFAIPEPQICDYKGQIAKVGATFQVPGECARYTCNKPNSVSAIGCAQHFADEPYKYVPQDDSKPYPECCPHYTL